MTSPTGRLLACAEPHQPEYAALARLGDRPGLFVDVGANIGQSIASLRLFATAMRAVCFEPLPWLEPALRELLDRGLIDAYHLVALGDPPAGAAAGALPLVLPRVDGHPLTTRASYHPERFTEPGHREILRAAAKRPRGAVAFETVTVPCARLDDFALVPTVLKLDVEGHELAVLAGARATIAAHRPWILLEPSRERPALARFLRRQGYRLFRWRDGGPVPWDGGPADNIWCEPEERDIIGRP